MARQSVSGTQPRRYRGMNSTHQQYVYGNVVEKPNYREEGPERNRKHVKKVKRNAQRISKGYVVFLAVAAIFALCVCVNYINLQTKVTVRSKHISTMQEELADLREENNTRYNVITDSVTLEEIGERAVNNLGMVYAQEGQVIPYDNGTGKYVKKYEDVPENGILATSKDTQDTQD